MPPNKKYKVLLIQLPAPQNAFQKQWGNVPLAAGYLKAMAHKEGLLHKIDIDILSEKDVNLSGDARLIDLIAASSADMLGFSLYLWNSRRSLFIAREVKKRTPRIKIMVGGPEVTPESRYILDDPAIDFGCLGEGEIPFTEILKALLNGGTGLTGIRGIFLKRSGQVKIAPPGAFIKDLDQIPSPFALGFIDPGLYPTVTYEGLRGCPFKCSYCATGSIPTRYFSADRICADLAIIANSGSRAVRFADSDLALHPQFYEIFERLKKINEHRRLRFNMFMYSGHLNKKRVDLLNECNIGTVEIGLQSLEPKTLANVHRPPLDKNKFLEGLKLLDEKGIFYRLDIMIGLPGDTLRGLKQTVRFLIDHGVKKERLWSFVLALLPGTRLRQEAKTHGIKYQRTPPYLLLEADYISKATIEKAKKLFQMKREPHFENTLMSYCEPHYPQPREKKTLGSMLKMERLNVPVNKVIFELDSSCQTRAQWKNVGMKLSRTITQPFTAWFKSQDLPQDLPLIGSMFLPIVRANPFLICDVILETPAVPSPAVIKKIKNMVPTKETIFSELTHVQNAIRIIVIHPWNNRKNVERELKKNKCESPFLWSLLASPDNPWRQDLIDLLRKKPDAGVLIDFDQKAGMDFVLDGLTFLNKNPATRSGKIFFRNFALQCFKNSLEREVVPGKDLLLKTSWADQPLLSLDRDLNIVSLTRSAEEAKMDAVQCQLVLNKILKEKP